MAKITDDADPCVWVTDKDPLWEDMCDRCFLQRGYRPRADITKYSAIGFGAWFPKVWFMDGPGKRPVYPPERPDGR